MSETTTENPSWLRRAWIGLTMVALLVLVLYIYAGADAGDPILLPALLAGVSVAIGAGGVGMLNRDEQIGVTLLRVATLAAIVGIVTFQF